MQRLKKARFVRASKTEQQINLSKCKAKNIPDEDCMADGNKESEYLVRSQTMATRDTWYHVIYKGLNLNFCNCKWALNGNICKHILKVEMVVTSNVSGGNELPNVSRSITERPGYLLDLNESFVMTPEIELNLPASPSTDSTIVRPDSALTIDEEIKLVMSSTHKRLRGLLQITPTTLEQAYALNQLVKNVSQEYNNKKFDVVTPSKVTTKRRHSFLSPTKKRGQSVPTLKSRKDGPQFLKVGRCRGRKRSMNEQLEISSTKEINLDHTSRRVQGCILQNTGMEISIDVSFYVKFKISLSSSPSMQLHNNVFFFVTAEVSTSQHTSSCQVRLFHENNVDPNMGGSLVPFPFDSSRPLAREHCPINSFSKYIS